MELKQYHKKTAVSLFWLAIILYFIGLIVLFYDVSSGPREISVERILLYFGTFGLGTFFALIAYWRMKQINEVDGVIKAIDDQHQFFSVKRMMFVKNVSLKEPFTFYSLEGKAIAKFHEKITPLQQLLRFTVGMFIPLNIFPLVLYLQAGERKMSIEKRGGLFQPYYLFDENQKLMAKYELSKKMFARYTLYVFNEEGEIFAEVKDDGSHSGYPVQSIEGKAYLFVRVGGVPTEALELFGTVQGDIVDIYHENLSEYEFLQLIVTPVIMKYTMPR